MPSIVYVITNPAMPGLVKIGKTSAEEAEVRLSQLYSVGVPFPFQLAFAAKVEDADSVERALHVAFGPNRVNPRREFFKIDPEQAIAILKLLHIGTEVTDDLQQAPSSQNVTAAEVEAGNEYERKRRPPLNFDELDIPLHSTLNFRDSEATAIVSSSRKVKVSVDAEEQSLTALTQSLLGGTAPTRRIVYYWFYKGKSLLDIYEETYPESE